MTHRKPDPMSFSGQSPTSDAPSPAAMPARPALPAARPPRPGPHPVSTLTRLAARGESQPQATHSNQPLTNERGNKMKNLVLVLVSLIMVLSASVPLAAASDFDFEVDTPEDLPDTDPSELNCEQSDDGEEGDCSLRTAIEEANDLFADDSDTVVRITLPQDTYALFEEIEVASKILLRGEGSVISGMGETRLFGITEKGDFFLTDVTLSDGMATDSGGAVSNSGSLELEACKLFDNTAGSTGGAIHTVNGSQLLIFTSELARNTAEIGGAIHNEGGYTLIIEGWLHNNNALSSHRNGSLGGAIYADREGETDISWSVLTKNYADRGGAISTRGFPLEAGPRLWIHDSTVSNNGAGSGGGIHSGDSHMEMRRVTISENYAVNNGGGLWVGDRYAGRQFKDFVNSTISNNHALNDGGGLYIYWSPEIQLSNLTITQNVADSEIDHQGQGGGIFIFGNSQPELQNTILAGNIDGDNDPTTDAPDCEGALVSEGYNLIGVINPICKNVGPGSSNDQTGTSDFPLDPGLDPLQPFGSYKLIHPLQAGSPAIDAGNPAGCTDNDGDILLWDQPGSERPWNEFCDIGAVEYVP